MQRLNMRRNERRKATYWPSPPAGTLSLPPCAAPVVTAALRVVAAEDALALLLA